MLAVHCRSTGKARLRRLELLRLSTILPWSPDIKTSFSEPTTPPPPLPRAEVRPPSNFHLLNSLPTPRIVPCPSPSIPQHPQPSLPGSASSPHERAPESGHNTHTNSSPAVIKLNGRHRSCPRPTPLSKLGHAAWALRYPLKYSLDARPTGLWTPCVTSAGDGGATQCRVASWGITKAMLAGWLRLGLRDWMAHSMRTARHQHLPVAACWVRATRC